MTQKYLDFYANPNSWKQPKTIPGALNLLNGNQGVNIEAIMLHIALRTRPPLSLGISLGDMWAWLRYIPSLDSSRDLRLREEWLDIDSHQKTILSDDFGVGFSSYFLTNAFGFSLVSPTNYFMDIAHGIVSLKKKSKRGPSKTPDYIAMDSHNQIFIFECKGTQTSRDSILVQFDSGRQQKSNLNIIPPAFVAEQLVTGLFIPQHNSKEDAYFYIEDPEMLGDKDKDSLSLEEIKKLIIQCELASSLHLVGIPTLGNLIALGQQGTDEEIRRARAECEFKRHIDNISNHYQLFVSEKNIFTNKNIKTKQEQPENKDIISGVEFYAGFDANILEKLLICQDVSAFLEELTSTEIQKPRIDIGSNSARLTTSLGLYLELKTLVDADLI